MSKYIDSNPWAGLSSYEDPEMAKREGRKPKLFCGRDEESHNVTQLITGNIFVTLYGKSGTGKTSLLNAGVFPRLRQKRYLPISIRLSMDALDISFQKCIINQLTKALGNAAGQLQTVEVVPLSAEEQQPDYLWSYFARTKFVDRDGRSLFPVIVFDQFEEIFRDRRKEAEVLLRQIAYMMDESHALSSRMVDGQSYKYNFNFRFVASIREDDLYRLEDSIDNCYLPELKRCRYRLRSLTRQGAQDAILIPGDGLFKTEEQKDIVDAIINKSLNEDGSLSTNIISLLCSRIFADYQKSNADVISLSLVDAFIKGNPFERFYEEATRGFSNREKSYLEDHFIDSSGRRNSVSESDFHHYVKHGDSLITGNKGILQRCFVNNNNSRIELIHDSFCQALIAQKEKRKRRKLKKLLYTIVGLGIVALLYNLWSNEMPVDIDFQIYEASYHNKDLPPLKDAIVTMSLDDKNIIDTIPSLDSIITFENIPRRYLNRQVYIKFTCLDYFQIDTALYLTKYVKLPVRRDPSIYGNIAFKLWNPGSEEAGDSIKIWIEGQDVVTDNFGYLNTFIPLERQKTAYHIESSSIYLIDSYINMPCGIDDVILFH